MSTNVLIMVQALDGGVAMALAILLTATFARSVAVAEQNQALVIVIAIALGAWFGLSSSIAVARDFGVASNGKLALALFGLALVVPVALGIAAATVLTSLRRLISQGSVHPGLIALHALRIIPGAVFLSMVPLGIPAGHFCDSRGSGRCAGGIGRIVRQPVAALGALGQSPGLEPDRALGPYAGHRPRRT